MSTTIQQNLMEVSQRIATSANLCDRDPKDITLIAVSKTKPVNLIEQAINAGQRKFGENYVQEGVDKIIHFSTFPFASELEWHFIGPLQSNKSRLVAEHFDWIHTLDREKLARRLHEQRPTDKPPINALIQVNISHEATKSGISESELFELAYKISQFDRVKLRGLMVIPAPETETANQLAIFKQAASLYFQLKEQFDGIDTLSMGMSEDMTAAIAAGSNMVRIGTAIFGQRNYP